MARALVKASGMPQAVVRNGACRPASQYVEAVFADMGRAQLLPVVLSTH